MLFFCFIEFWITYGNPIIIRDPAWENRSYVHILYFEKYEFEILNALFFSCGTVQSRQIYYINVYSYSYHFIAISIRYLNAAGFFGSVFSLPVISRIESIGGGRVGGGRWGKVRSQRRAKATIWTQTAVLYPQYGTRTGTIHRGAKTAVRSNLVPHAVLLMPLWAKKCILVVLQHR